LNDDITRLASKQQSISTAMNLRSSSIKNNLRSSSTKKSAMVSLTSAKRSAVTKKKNRRIQHNLYGSIEVEKKPTAPRCTDLQVLRSASPDAPSQKPSFVEDLVVAPRRITPEKSITSTDLPGLVAASIACSSPSLSQDTIIRLNRLAVFGRTKYRATRPDPPSG
jgi:hypothetical protein